MRVFHTSSFQYELEWNELTSLTCSYNFTPQPNKNTYVKHSVQFLNKLISWSTSSCKRRNWVRMEIFSMAAIGFFCLYYRDFIRGRTVPTKTEICFHCQCPFCICISCSRNEDTRCPKKSRISSNVPRSTGNQTHYCQYCLAGYLRNYHFDFSPGQHFFFKFFRFYV